MSVSEDSESNKISEPISGVVWEANNASTTCNLCNKRFGRFKHRRHHCRYCGKLICGDCSTHKAIIPFLQSNGSKELTMNTTRESLSIAVQPTNNNSTITNNNNSNNPTNNTNAVRVCDLCYQILSVKEEKQMLKIHQLERKTELLILSSYISECLLDIFFLDGSYKTVCYDHSTTIKDLCLMITQHVRIGLYQVNKDIYNGEEYLFLFEDMLLCEILDTWKQNKLKYAKIVIPLYESQFQTIPLAPTYSKRLQGNHSIDQSTWKIFDPTMFDLRSNSVSSIAPSVAMGFQTTPSRNYLRSKDLGSSDLMPEKPPSPSIDPYLTASFSLSNTQINYEINALQAENERLKRELSKATNKLETWKAIYRLPSIDPMSEETGPGLKTASQDSIIVSGVNQSMNPTTSTSTTTSSSSPWKRLSNVRRSFVGSSSQNQDKLEETSRASMSSNALPPLSQAFDRLTIAPNQSFSYSQRSQRMSFIEDPLTSGMSSSKLLPWTFDPIELDCLEDPLSYYQQNQTNQTKFVQRYYHHISHIHSFIERYEQFFECLTVTLFQNYDPNNPQSLPDLTPIFPHKPPQRKSSSRTPSYDEFREEDGNDNEDFQDDDETNEEMDQDQQLAMTVSHIYEMSIALDLVYAKIVDYTEVLRPLIRTWLIKLFPKVIRLPIHDTHSTSMIISCLIKEQMFYHNHINNNNMSMIHGTNSSTSSSLSNTSNLTIASIIQTHIHHMIETSLCNYIYYDTSFQQLIVVSPANVHNILTIEPSYTTLTLTTLLKTLQTWYDTKNNTALLSLSTYQALIQLIHNIQSTHMYLLGDILPLFPNFNEILYYFCQLIYQLYQQLYRPYYRYILPFLQDKQSQWNASLDIFSFIQFIPKIFAPFSTKYSSPFRTTEETNASSMPPNPIPTTYEETQSGSQAYHTHDQQLYLKQMKTHPLFAYLLSMIFNYDWFLQMIQQHYTLLASPLSPNFAPSNLSTPGQEPSFVISISQYLPMNKLIEKVTKYRQETLQFIQQWIVLEHQAFYSWVFNYVPTTLSNNISGGVASVGPLNNSNNVANNTTNRTLFETDDNTNEDNSNAPPSLANPNNTSGALVIGCQYQSNRSSVYYMKQLIAQYQSVYGITPEKDTKDTKDTKDSRDKENRDSKDSKDNHKDSSNNTNNVQQYPQLLWPELILTFQQTYFQLLWILYDHFAPSLPSSQSTSSQSNNPMSTTSTSNNNNQSMHIFQHLLPILFQQFNDFHHHHLFGLGISKFMIIPSLSLQTFYQYFQTIPSSPFLVPPTSSTTSSSISFLSEQMQQIIYFSAWMNSLDQYCLMYFDLSTKGSTNNPYPRWYDPFIYPKISEDCSLFLYCEEMIQKSMITTKETWTACILPQVHSHVLQYLYVENTQFMMTHLFQVPKGSSSLSSSPSPGINNHNSSSGTSASGNNTSNILELAPVLTNLFSDYLQSIDHHHSHPNNQHNSQNNQSSFAFIYFFYSFLLNPMPSTSSASNLTTGGNISNLSGKGSLDTQTTNSSRTNTPTKEKATNKPFPLFSSPSKQSNNSTNPASSSTSSTTLKTLQTSQQFFLKMSNCFVNQQHHMDFAKYFRTLVTNHPLVAYAFIWQYYLSLHGFFLAPLTSLNTLYTWKQQQYEQQLNEEQEKKLSSSNKLKKTKSNLLNNNNNIQNTSNNNISSSKNLTLSISMIPSVSSSTLPTPLLSSFYYEWFYHILDTIIVSYSNSLLTTIMGNVFPQDSLPCLFNSMNNNHHNNHNFNEMLSSPSRTTSSLYTSSNTTIKPLHLQTHAIEITHDLHQQIQYFILFIDSIKQIYQKKIPWTMTYAHQQAMDTLIQPLMNILLSITMNKNDLIVFAMQELYGQYRSNQWIYPNRLSSWSNLILDVINNPNNFISHFSPHGNTNDKSFSTSISSTSTNITSSSSTMNQESVVNLSLNGLIIYIIIALWRGQTKEEIMLDYQHFFLPFLILQNKEMIATSPQNNNTTNTNNTSNNTNNTTSNNTSENSFAANKRKLLSTSSSSSQEKASNNNTNTNNTNNTTNNTTNTSSTNTTNNTNTNTTNYQINIAYLLQHKGLTQFLNKLSSK